jgi:hypothetical protein
VTYPGFTPVGNATLVVANVLTCNKHSQIMAIIAWHSNRQPSNIVWLRAASVR